VKKEVPIHQVVAYQQILRNVKNRQICQRTGVGEGTYSKFLSGKRLLAADQIRAILQFLGVDAYAIPMAVSAIPHVRPHTSTSATATHRTTTATATHRTTTATATHRTTTTNANDTRKRRTTTTNATHNRQRPTTSNSTPTAPSFTGYTTTPAKLECYRQLVTTALGSHKFLRPINAKLHPIFPDTLSLVSDVSDPRAFINRLDEATSDGLLQCSTGFTTSPTSNIKYEVCFRSPDKLFHVFVVPVQTARFAKIHVADVPDAADLPLLFGLVFPFLVEPEVSELHLALDLANDPSHVGVDYPSVRGCELRLRSDRLPGGSVAWSSHFKVGSSRRPSLVRYSKGPGRATRLERKLLRVGHPFSQLSSLPNPFADLLLYDLDPSRLCHPAYREAVAGCFGDLALLRHRHPDLAEALLVVGDPNHPRALWDRCWPRVVRWLAGRLGVPRSALGPAPPQRAEGRGRGRGSGGRSGRGSEHPLERRRARALERGSGGRSGRGSEHPLERRRARARARAEAQK